ncbi:hypothetical protein [Rhodococcus wratislaviensis]|uniref:hypothetical protein n=1 Tax=Rhodococcus wratislaviensis TaxID=44752 RepID=UPI000F58A73A|nr:hypothetical protein [Rhodococcus wratislaviensis]
MLKGPDEIRRQIQYNERVRHAALLPSPMIERLVLQIIGGWSTLVEEVRFLRYNVANDPDGKEPHPNADNLHRNIRKLGLLANLRLPGDNVTAACQFVRQMRNDLAHMLYIDSITGDEPNRRLAFLRSGEMSYSGNGWVQHERKRVEVTEEDLRKALSEIKWLMDCCFAIRKVGWGISRYEEDEPIDFLHRLLPWWFEEWGDAACRGPLTLREIRAIRD